VGKRPGRKRSQGVERHPGGQINDYGGRVYPPNTQMNQEVVWEEGRNRGERYLVRPSARVVRTLYLTERQVRAAEEFAALRMACARYSWEAPALAPKVSSPFLGKAHPPEKDPDHIVSLGVKFHARYMDVVKWATGRVQWDEGAPQRGFLGIAVKVCLEGQKPSEHDFLVLSHGLNILAERWKL
jgi:hypothetical protein